MIHTEKPGTTKAILAHPNMVFGYNPPIPLNIGIIDFTRFNAIPTTAHGVYESMDSMPVEYENVFQALGRLARNTNSDAWLFINETAFYSPLRFRRPKPPTRGIP